MTDRELLELAAKAAGVVHPEVLERHLKSGWNPLTDDGDALRLAVKLKMDINYGFAATQINVSRYNWAEEIEDVSTVENGAKDPYAATRRAIVRAAAEIGKESK